MTATEIVRDFITALENNDRERAGSHLADSFLCNGWTPKPLRKAAFLNVIGGLKAGFPDLSFNLRDVQEQDQHLVTTTIQVTGTQTDEFILPELGLPPIPETHRYIALPTQEVRFELSGGQITQMLITPVHGGDIHGLIRQLGIDVLIVQ